ncbi:MAG: DEAD/DEAH box helicase [Planctomycetaceae bacterium]|jgi:SNF2 family DNA or RNA helicase|nr:DEAD/DEAH box helicase [Planctomycetaceae bacterium]
MNNISVTSQWFQTSCNTSQPFGCNVSVLPSVDFHITGWNQAITRGIDIGVQTFNPAIRSKPQVFSLPIGKRSRTDIKSWFFVPPVDIVDNGHNTEKSEPFRKVTNEQSSDFAAAVIDIEQGNEQNADNCLELPEKVTRIQVPRDAIKLVDKLSYLLQPPLESILNLPTLELPFEPYPYQKQGIAFLYSAEFAILADEMGLGKTMQAIASIRLLLRTCELRSVLLVCPKPLVTNWQREFDLWAPEINVQVIDGNHHRRKWLWQSDRIPVRIANYELLHRDREYYDCPSNMGGTTFDLVVLDESQRIKNVSSSTSQAARSIPRKRSWALTGTPVENSQEDLVGIFEFLAPGFLQSGLKPSQVADVVGEHILRRTKDDVNIDLPERSDRDVQVVLSESQWSTYKQAEDEGSMRLNEMGDGISIQNVFELVMRLKQICNYDPISGESTKLERLAADMEEIAQSGRKAIIFSQWVETLTFLKSRLEGFNPVEYHGRIPHSQRDLVIEKFRSDNECHIILMSYGAGSVGLNLQFAQYVFLFDRWWNPAVEDQAIARAHRIGGKDKVLVTRFISVDTVEERIDRILREKRELSKLILSGARGMNDSTGLNQEEIFGLFNLKKPKKRKAEGHLMVG